MLKKNNTVPKQLDQSLVTRLCASIFLNFWCDHQGAIAELAFCHCPILTFSGRECSVILATSA